MLVKTILKESPIHGIGLFAAEDIKAGTKIWEFTKGFDQRFTREEILSFPDLLQIYMYKYCWRSKKSLLYCLASDNGKYFNHSENQNSESCYEDSQEEICTYAIKDIKTGEEITDNYNSFEELYSEGDVLDEIAIKFNLEDELDPRFKSLSAEEK